MKRKAALLMVLSAFVSGCDRVPLCSDMQSSIIDDLAASSRETKLEFKTIEEKSVSEKSRRRSCATTIQVVDSGIVDKKDIFSDMNFDIEYEIVFNEKNGSYGIKYEPGTGLNKIKALFTWLSEYKRTGGDLEKMKPIQ